MVKSIKKILALLLAASMVLSMLSMTALADEGSEPAPKTSQEQVEERLNQELGNAKFVAIIASQGAPETTKVKDSTGNVISETTETFPLTQVVGTVGADYVAKLVIPAGMVNTDNVTVGVGMKDVASLGIKGTRAHAMSLATGIKSQNVSLGWLLELIANSGNEEVLSNVSNAVSDTKIHAVIINPDNTKEKVTYGFGLSVNKERQADENGETVEVVKDLTVTARPVGNASAAWQHMMENFSAGTQSADSFLLIKNGSWLQVGNQKLVFENAQDLKLDNLQNMGTGDITASVKLEETADSALRFCLKKGTTLAVDSSSAVLNQDLVVTITGHGDEEINIDDSILPALQEAAGKGAREVVKTLVFDTMIKTLGMVVGQEIDVTMQFGTYDLKASLENQIANGAKFVGIVASTNVDGTTTEVIGTVDSGYKATLVIPNADVNANSLWLGVGMNNVGSLGGGKHTQGLGEFHIMGDSDSGIGLNIFKTLHDFGCIIKNSDEGFDALRDFNDATINATIVPATGEADAKEVTYKLEGKWTDADGKTITGIPSGDVSAAWAAMVNDVNFSVTTQKDSSGKPVDDSHIIIASGSWLQIGDQVLKFEDGAENITLFTTDSDGVASILAKVKLENGEAPAMSFGLTKGTTLAVGSSVATLKNDVQVTVDGISADALNVGDQNILAALQEAVNGGEDPNMVLLLVQLAALMDQAVAAVDASSEINVKIEFTCAEHEYEDVVTEPTCTEGGYTTHTCKVCNDTYTDTETEATGHTEAEAVRENEVAPTCTVAGSHDEVVYCSVCDEEVSRTTATDPATGHGAARASTVGYITTYRCSVCNALLRRVDNTPDDEEIDDPENPPLSEKPFLFADVAVQEWFYEDVKKAYAKDLMIGVSDTDFAPYMNTTRAMVAQVLYRLAGEPGIEEYTVDIPDLKDDWSHDATVWAFATGVFTGYAEDGTFRGDWDISREELAIVLLRYAKLMGYDVTDTDDLSAFADEETVHDWALESVQWAVGAGMIKGRAEDKLALGDKATRAELSTILVRFTDKYDSTDVA